MSDVSRVVDEVVAAVVCSGEVRSDFVVWVMADVSVVDTACCAWVKSVE